VPRRDGDRLACSLLWQRQDVPSMEHFRLWEHDDGPRLEGTVVLVQGMAPATVEYEVACAPDWTTRRALVEAVVAGVPWRTELVVEGGRWWRDGRELPELSGCVDVDVSVTPATNTLPIRRLGLAAGESRAVDAAWVRVGAGGVTVERLPQRYTRLVGGRYRYESGGGAFTALLDVDDAGVVLRYPPAWERVPLVAPGER
jgi:uncharacterized protein